MRIWLMLILMLSLLLPIDALAATLNLVQSGGSTYVLQGNGFNGVAALDATISYDSSTLGSPQVTQGSLADGTLFVSNPNLAGQVKIAFVHTSGISGSGPIATITFTPAGAGIGTINSMTATILNAKGAALPVTIGIGNVQQSEAVDGGGWPVVQQSAPGTASQSSARVTTEVNKVQSVTGSAALPGTLTIAGESKVDSESAKQVPAEPLPPPPANETEKKHVTAIGETVPLKPRERPVLPAPPANVLERFRTYAGELTLQALKPLFAKRSGNWIAQDPDIAVADGKRAVKIVITIDRMGEEAPSFALSNLKTVVLKITSEAGWLIECVPATGVVQASVSMLLNGSPVDIPVTVLPPLPAAWNGKELTESEVNRFLKERGTEKSPVGDLNGDGRHDYIDDYIMVGNYLAATQYALKAEAPVGRQEPSSPSLKKGAN